MISIHCREMISYHFTVELSNQIDCNKLVGPIGLHVIRYLAAGAKFGGKNCFVVLSMKWLLEDLFEALSQFLKENKNKNTARNCM